MKETITEIKLIECEDGFFLSNEEGNAKYTKYCDDVEIIPPNKKKIKQYDLRFSCDVHKTHFVDFPQHKIKLTLRGDYLYVYCVFFEFRGFTWGGAYRNLEGAIEIVCKTLNKFKNEMSNGHNLRNLWFENFVSTDEEERKFSRFLTQIGNLIDKFERTANELEASKEKNRKNRSDLKDLKMKIKQIEKICSEKK
jgi:hypothetical protein